MSTHYVQCQYNQLLSSYDKCEYTKTCQFSFFYINLLQLLHCNLSNSLLLLIPLSLLIILICFFLLSDTSNKYILGTLTLLSDKFKLSQNLSALTLLALGNGSTDIISSIVCSLSSKNDEDSFDMSIGSLLGSGMVLTSFVFSLVILFSKDGVKVVPKMYIRESVFYMLSLIVLILFLVDGIIYLWEAICFSLIYFINIFFALYIESIERKKRISNRLKPVSDVSDEENQNEKLVLNNQSQIDNDNQQVNLSTKTESDLELKNTNTDIVLNNEEIENYVEDIADIAVGKHIFSSSSSDDETKARQSLIFKSRVLNKKNNGIFFRIKRHYFQHMENFHDLSLLKKIVYVIIEFPFTILRDLTIPTVDEKKFHKKLFCLYPIFSLFGSITLLNIWNLLIEHWYILVSLSIISIIFSIILFIFIKDTLPETIIPICIINFIMSIIWLYAITKVIIDIINIFGFIFNIPNSFLGLTIIAIGNSAPDMGLNCSLSKSGFGEMAIAGSISGPFFNLSIGLLFTLIIKLVSSPIEITFFDKKGNSILVAFICLFVNLILNLIVAKINNYNLKRINAYISMIIFSIYIITISILTFI